MMDGVVRGVVGGRFRVAYGSSGDTSATRNGGVGRASAGLGRGVGAVLLGLSVGACSGGGAPSRDAPDASISPSPSATGGVPTTDPTTSRPVPPEGSVAFTVVGATLLGPGLRVLLETSGATVEVVARGVAGPSNRVLACPVEGISDTPDEAGCVIVTDGRAASVGLPEGSSGLLLRAVDDPVRVAEMTLIYVPEGDSITVVTPPMAPSEASEIAFELTPTGPGNFVLKADGRDARPRLTVQSGLPSGPSRVLAIVEGGGALAITSTLDGRSDARLTVRNVGAMEMPPMEIGLSWPSRR